MDIDLPGIDLGLTGIPFMAIQTINTSLSVQDYIQTQLVALQQQIQNLRQKAKTLPDDILQMKISDLEDLVTWLNNPS